MSHILNISLDGSENGTKGLEVLKNLPSGITTIRFYDNERSEYFHEVYFEEEEDKNKPVVETVPNYDGPLEGIEIPEQITELNIDLVCATINPSIFPKHGNLKVLKCRGHFTTSITKDTFPEGLEELYFPSHGEFTMDCIPRSIKILDMQSRYDPTTVEYPSSFFPEGLLRFSAPGSFVQSLSILPRGLQFLELNWRFSVNIAPGDIPSSVKYLNLSSDGRTNDFIGVTTLLVPGSIPEGVLVLDFNSGFNQDLAGLLPSTLVKCRIQSKYTHQFKKGDFPDSLRILDLAFLRDTKCEFNSDNLPPNLKVLRLPDEGVTLANGFNPSIETITYGTLNYDFKAVSEEKKQILNL